MKHIIQGLVTVFPSMNTGKSASENFINYTKKSVDNTPAYVMIETKDNSRTEQVESGMLYSRLVLTGHELGLAMQPLSQTLEEYPRNEDTMMKSDRNTRQTAALSRCCSVWDSQLPAHRSVCAVMLRRL